MAIAKPLDIDEITTSHFANAPRNDNKINSRPFRKKRRVAFTLAEVLITLGIIGVVAVLTLSSVISNYQEKATVAKVKKAYNILEQAIEQMVEDEGTIDTWGDTNAKNQKFTELAPKYFQLLKKYDGTVYHVGNIKYKNRFNSTIVGYGQPYGNYYLSDGIIIHTKMGGMCYQTKNLSKGYPGLGHLWGSYLGLCGTILVDINGEKGPNMYDKDAFLFSIAIDGIVPAGGPRESVWTETFENQCLGKNLGGGPGGAKCTAWVIFNENMDYLHCDDLSWTGKRKCKDK